ncbi:MAG TPA: helix-turn-helix transcriptional regulator [Bryobacteraceae bacterium]|jgi:AraC-like DNA-binding protein|nr:helix-turn-helix transcriptional regulator [Bryobacteraceae bacterium]
MQELDSASTLAFIRDLGIENGRISACSYVDRNEAVRYAWHTHSKHQLLYALRGTLQLEAAGARYFLPAQRAAWIAAGTPHRTTVAGASGISVYFHPRLIAWQGTPVRVIAPSPLLREMVRGAYRWPAHSKGGEAVRRAYFRTLALLFREWLETPLPFSLPETDDPALGRAIAFTMANLDKAGALSASAAALMSERSFRRHFKESLGLCWREYLLKARMLRAMELLSGDDRTIAQIASEVGFESAGGFAHAFSRFTNESPAEFRRRVREIS